MIPVPTIWKKKVEKKLLLQCSQDTNYDATQTVWLHLEKKYECVEEL